jgi:uracil-DNA glycosylase family 4
MTQFPDEWEKLRQEILECQRCPLAKSRSQTVPGAGPSNAQLVFIGEAPGRQEDIKGEPFVGAAGQLLTKLLEQVGIKRESVFITNVVKCRPPENRQPTQSERTACRPFLNRQLRHIQPRVIALVGRVPAETLLETPVRMGAMHGRTYYRNNKTYFVMYHPAAGLYNQNLVPTLEGDMQKLKNLLDNDSTPSEQGERGQLPLSEFFSKEKK